MWTRPILNFIVGLIAVPLIPVGLAYGSYCYGVFVGINSTVWPLIALGGFISLIGSVLLACLVIVSVVMVVAFLAWSGEAIIDFVGEKWSARGDED